MTKHVKLSVVIVGVFILFLIGYSLRGFTRLQIIPSFANHAADTKVDDRFNETYPAIKQQLTKLGLAFPEDNSIQLGCGTGEQYVQYQGLHETVICYKRVVSKNVPTSAQFVSKWAQKTPQLESYLKANGWKQQSVAKSTISKQSLHTLYSNPTSAEQGATIMYQKNSAGTFCSVGFYLYGRTNTGTTDSSLQVDYQCTHQTTIFGGY